MTTRQGARLAFLLDDADDADRHARLRELRCLSAVFLGWDHPATIELRKALGEPAAVAPALALLDAAPALRRRRLLAAYGALRLMNQQ